MSTSVFPSAILNNLSFPVKAKATFQNRKPRSVGGKETSINLQPYPDYTWDLPIQLLRQGSTPPLGPWTEEATLQGFVEQMKGGFDTWLWTAYDDNTVTGQAIQNTVTGGTAGDGSTLTFQLLRTRGGATMPILGPNVVSNVYVNGVVVSAANYTVNNWGSSTPGVITFGAGHAPGAALPVTADFTYYFVVRFLMDEQEFERFMTGLWEVKSLKFRSIL